MATRALITTLRAIAMPLLMAASLSMPVVLRAMDLEICPAWTVVVLDEKGLPVAGLKAFQTWQYDGIDEKAQQATQHSETKVTDALGRVSFPARQWSIGAAAFVAARATHAVSLNAHESFGPSSDINITTPAGYKLAPSVGSENGEVLPYVTKPDPHGKTVQDKTGLTSTIHLERLDLFDAMRRGDAAKAREFLVGDPALAKTPNAIGDTPLHALCESALGLRPEGIELAKLLIADGADVNAPAKDGLSPLLRTARHGTYAVMELLIAHGADVHLTAQDSKNPNQPIHLSVITGFSDADRKIKTIDLLLRHGVDVNVKRANDGNTPLHLAADYGDASVVQALLDRGADPTARNTHGQTPLDFIKHYNDSAGMRAIRAALAKPVAETKPASASPVPGSPAK